MSEFGPFFCLLPYVLTVARDDFRSQCAGNVNPPFRRLQDDRLRGTLNTLVRNMPPGTYAELLPEEKALLADRDRVHVRASRHA